MSVTGRLAAFVLTALLGFGSLPLYVCGESASPACPSSAPMVGCPHDMDAPATLTCCCSATDAPATPTATVVTSLPALQPAAGEMHDWTAVVGVRLGAGQAESESFRTRDLPTLFSTFLL
jgi:hypothetical protein